MILVAENRDFNAFFVYVIFMKKEKEKEK